jgi:hypothetical protein
MLLQAPALHLNVGAIARCILVIKVATRMGHLCTNFHYGER